MKPPPVAASRDQWVLHPLFIAAAFVVDIALANDVAERSGSWTRRSCPGAQDLFDTPPTPVNLFPILFNRYFGTHLPLTADRYFLAPSPFDLLELTEVADPDTRSP
jgi:hypothetical protein